MWCTTLCVTAQQTAEIKPYTDYLSSTRPLSAKEYILSLFQDHDIVVLCERDHRDLTQYHLILDVLRDPYFIEHVGVLFNEVGSRSLNPALNTFIKTDGLTREEVDKRILDFRRNMYFYPTWPNYNWTYLANGIYDINRSLPPHKKLDWYPCDIAFDTREASEESLAQSYQQFDGTCRDSLMADYILRTFKQLKEKNPARKALIIMNYRHAFSPGYRRRADEKAANTARYLFEAFPHRCANVFINFFTLAEIKSDTDMSIAPVQNGKWDAAFHKTGLRDVGFHFKGSPFGKDSFDLDHRTCAGTTYQDVFTGYVFYRPISEFEIVTGVPHIAEDGFADEYARREELYHRIYRTENPRQARQSILNLNTKQTRQEDFLKELTRSIQQWLK